MPAGFAKPPNAEAGPAYGEGGMIAAADRVAARPQPTLAAIPAYTAAANTVNSVLIEVTRGSIVESRHRGAAVVATADGSLLIAVGRFGDSVLPRSAIKPLQAIPLIETGAADRYGIAAEEIALACASHSGDPRHVALVSGLLNRLGLTAADLVCGSHLLLHGNSAAALLRSGRHPSGLHNNCSGKHAGFLATACHMGEPILGYADPQHPVQRRVVGVLGQMSCIPSEDLVSVVDGCGAPNFALPLSGLAIAMARLVAPDRGTPKRATAASRIVTAMVSHPHLVAGTERFDTAVMTAASGRLISKGGAEGVQAAALVHEGIGIAVKIDDGAKRAAECAMATLLLRLIGHDNAVAEEDELLRHVLGRLSTRPVSTVAGDRVGVIQPAAEWTAALSAAWTAG